MSLRPDGERPAGPAHARRSNTVNSTLVPLPLEVLGEDAYPTVLLTVTAVVRVVAVALVLLTRGWLGYDADGRQRTP